MFLVGGSIPKHGGVGGVPCFLGGPPQQEKKKNNNNKFFLVCGDRRFVCWGSIPEKWRGGLCPLFVCRGDAFLLGVYPPKNGGVSWGVVLFFGGEVLKQWRRCSLFFSLNTSPERFGHSPEKSTDASTRPRVPQYIDLESISDCSLHFDDGKHIYVTTKPFLCKCWSIAGTSPGTPITGHRGGLGRVFLL